MVAVIYNSTMQIKVLKANFSLAITYIYTEHMLCEEIPPTLANVSIAL
jgi:hypothetical protein